MKQAIATLLAVKAQHKAKGFHSNPGGFAELLFQCRQLCDSNRIFLLFEVSGGREDFTLLAATAEAPNTVEATVPDRFCLVRQPPELANWSLSFARFDVLDCAGEHVELAAYGLLANEGNSLLSGDTKPGLEQLVDDHVYLPPEDRNAS